MKMAPKSGVTFEKWLQKVEHLFCQVRSDYDKQYKRWVKKWSTFMKMAPKSGVLFEK